MQPTATYNPVPTPAVVYIPANAVPVTGTRSQYPLLLPYKVVVLQIIIGAICLACNVTSLGVYNGRSFGSIGHGLWSGALFIVTGVIGRLAIKQKTRCKIVSYMVLCIVSASSSAVLLSLGIVGALMPFYRRIREIVVESVMATAGLIEGILGIYGAAQCCKSGVCCCSETAMVPGNALSNNGMLYVYNVQGLQFPYPEISPTPYGQQGPTVAVSPTFQPQFDPRSGMVQEQHSIGTAVGRTPGDNAALHDEQTVQTSDSIQLLPSTPPPPYSVCYNMQITPNNAE